MCFKWQQFHPNPIRLASEGNIVGQNSFKKRAKIVERATLTTRGLAVAAKGANGCHQALQWLPPTSPGILATLGSIYGQNFT